jgi:hypothetical protein
VDGLDEFPEDIQNYLERADQGSPNRLKFDNLHFFGCCPHCDSGNQQNKKQKESAIDAES